MQARLWTNDTELLAQVVEMVSVVAAERKIGVPVQIRRPSWLTAGRAASGRNPFSAAIDRMRGASSRRTGG